VLFVGQGEFPQYCISRNFSIWGLFLGSGGTNDSAERD